VVDQQRASPHHGISRFQYRVVRSCITSPMLYRSQQPRVDTRKPCETLGVQPVVLAAAFPDQPDLPWIRHYHLMPQLFQNLAHPR
jgi:hypothetical protein